MALDYRQKLHWAPLSAAWIFAVLTWFPAPAPIMARSGTDESPVVADQHDGSHDFDFLIGHWKAHVRRLPERLVGSHAWIEYDGISNHKKLLDSNANFEEFEVDNADKHLHIKRRPCGSITPNHTSGVFTFWTSTKAF
jgi:hypothetical protein